MQRRKGLSSPFQVTVPPGNSIEVVRAAENPFTLAIAMMGMLGSRAKLDELVDTAQRHEEFYDFHQAGEDGTATVDETVAALLADT